MTEVPEEVREAYRELPQGWKLEKLKFFANVRNSNVDKTISEDEEAVRLCNYTDVYYNDRITLELHFAEGSATESEIERFQLKRDQVIITKDSEGWDDIGIPALVAEDMPEVLCGYHLSVFEPGSELDGGFLAWLCRAEPLNDQFKLAAKGVTRFGLGQYPMKNAFIALPPLDLQRRIARFLDEKTARIDGLIEKIFGHNLSLSAPNARSNSNDKSLLGLLMELPLRIDYGGGHWSTCGVTMIFDTRTKSRLPKSLSNTVASEA